MSLQFSLRKIMVTSYSTNVEHVETNFCFENIDLNDHLIFVWRRCADVIDKQGDSGKTMPKQECCKSKCIQPKH